MTTAIETVPSVNVPAPQRVMSAERIERNQHAKGSTLTPEQKLSEQIDGIYGQLRDAVDCVPSVHGQSFETAWVAEVETKAVSGDLEAAFKAAQRLSGRYRPLRAVGTAHEILKGLVEPYEQFEDAVGANWLSQVEPAMERGHYRDAANAAWSIVENFRPLIVGRDYDEAKRALAGLSADPFFSAITLELEPVLAHVEKVREVLAEAEEVAREAESEEVAGEFKRTVSNLFRQVSNTCRYILRNVRRARKAPNAQEHFEQVARETAEARRQRHEGNREQRRQENFARSKSSGAGTKQK